MASTNYDMSIFKYEEGGVFGTPASKSHEQSGLTPLLWESGFLSGGTQSRECWKILPRNNYGNDNPSAAVYYVKRYVSDNKFAMRNHEKVQEADDMYVTSVVTATVAGRIAYNMRKGIHKCSMTANPSKYVQAVIEAMASGNDVDADGAYIKTIQLCGLAEDQRRGTTESLRGRELEVMEFARQIARHQSKPHEGIRCVEIEGTEMVVVMSREYNSGVCRGIDRQHFQNYLPCGYMCRLEDSSLKTCYCRTTEMDQTFSSCFSNIEHGKKDFIKLLHTTHYYSPGCASVSISSVLVLICLLSIYFTLRKSDAIIKDDIEVVLLSMSAASVLFSLCKHIWYSQEEIPDVVRGKRKVRTPADIGISLKGDLLRRLMLYEDAGTLFSGTNSCVFTNNPRGRLVLDNPVSVRDLRHVGVFVAESAMILAGKRGLDYYKLSTAAHERFYNNTGIKVDGLIVSAWASDDATVGGHCRDLLRNP